MKKDITFGTDGWRAILGREFTKENVAIVANAIGKYVFDTFGINKKIIIGYDPRNMAREFTQQTAEILASKGFNVFISKNILPTPVIAYGAKELNASAIMFTASHNPPEYLGMKFIPDYAGPATEKITDAIVENLGKEVDSKGQGDISEYDFAPSYFEHIKKIIDFNAVKTLKQDIIFDGMHAASIGYFDKLLDDEGIKYDSLNMDFDPNFGGKMPEPKPKFLKELIEKVKTTKNSAGAVGVANDGDADRFGLVNEKGEYVSPNEVIAILLLYLKQIKKLDGPLVKTVSGSLMLNNIANKLDIKIIETPVGFKYVGEEMRVNNAIIGGEESGGLSIQGHIPEKDGILANLLMLEAMATKNKSLVELQEEIRNFTECDFINDRIDMKVENFDVVQEALKKAMNLESVGEIKVTRHDFKDGVKMFLEDESSWILVRPSGTEPLLRIYFETVSTEKMQYLQDNLKIT